MRQRLHKKVNCAARPFGRIGMAGNDSSSIFAERNRLAGHDGAVARASLDRVPWSEHTTGAYPARQRVHAFVHTESCRPWNLWR